MASLLVRWDDPNFEIGRGIEADRRKRLSGQLTTEHERASEGQPVLVEEITKKVYLPTDLPAGTMLEMATDATELPEVALQARQAGYQVAGPAGVNG
jgi:hypothetical protein